MGGDTSNYLIDDINNVAKQCYGQMNFNYVTYHPSCEDETEAQKRNKGEALRSFYISFGKFRANKAVKESEKNMEKQLEKYFNNDCDTERKDVSHIVERKMKLFKEMKEKRRRSKNYGK